MSFRQEISLLELNKAVRKKEEVPLTKNEAISANEIVIVKRDGREERYQPNKMRKVVSWACEVANGSGEFMTKELLSDVTIKMYNRIKIVDVYDELIKTAVNKISMLYPQWEYIAARLYLLKIYKESWGIVGNVHQYPHIKNIIEKGISYKIFNRELFDKFSEEELDEINSFIVKDRDYLFTFKSLMTFYDKYCLNYTKTKILEIPQFAYMRVAMVLMSEEKDNRLQKIKELYDNLSTHKFTLATPIMLNSGTINQQLSSCVLNKVSDDSHSILDTNKNLGIYSKFKGGTALDVSELRAKGSYISGNQGQSSGPVPFIKIVESTLSAFNQGGKRPGACAVYFQWWHYDFDDLIVLKSNGGTEDNRARKLKYGLKINDLLLERFKNNETVSLFDPKDVKELFGLVGEDFNKKYAEYEQRVGIRKKTIPARELLFKTIKERAETGNIYLFHEENVNIPSLLNRYINSSNLCVAGDTKINILYSGFSKTIEIKNLEKYLGEGDVYVTSNSTDNLSVSGNEFVEYKKITNFALMNNSANVLKIWLECGRNITCTPDHKIWTHNTGYKLAKNLTPEDLLETSERGNSFNYKQSRVKSIEYLEQEIPVYDITVEGNHNFYANDILVHNCTEIILPTVASTSIQEKIVKTEDNNTEVHKSYQSGEIALCNLASINLVQYSKLTELEQQRLTDNVILAMDNTIDLADYPVKEAKVSNKKYRYLGIGVSNFANYLAEQGIVIDSKEAQELTHELFDTLSYKIITSSLELSKKLGPFEGFKETRWSDGKVPIHFANKKAMALTDYQPDMDKWNSLGQEIKQSGIRNAQLMAIAPTACQTIDGKIKTSAGTKSLGQICEEQGIDWKYIEAVGQPQWFDFNNPIDVQTRFGLKKSTRIWYNGNQPTRKIKFSDGNVYTFTHNHKLLVNCVDGQQRWICVSELKPGDDIVEI